MTRLPLDTECWLTDMDGVLVHENHAIPGASDLIERWVDTSKRFLVLTNNSIYSPADLSARLRRSGLVIPEDNLWTSALATADFLAQQHPGARLYVIGESGLISALLDAGVDPDLAVTTFWSLNYLVVGLVHEEQTTPEDGAHRFEQELAAHSFPALTSVRDLFLDDNAAAHLEFGMDALLHRARHLD